MSSDDEVPSPDMKWLKTQIEAYRGKKPHVKGDTETRMSLELSMLVVKSQEKLTRALERSSASQDRFAVIALILTAAIFAYSVYVGIFL